MPHKDGSEPSSPAESTGKTQMYGALQSRDLNKAPLSVQA